MGLFTKKEKRGAPEGSNEMYFHFLAVDLSARKYTKLQGIKHGNRQTAPYIYQDTNEEYINSVRKIIASEGLENNITIEEIDATETFSGRGCEMVIKNLSIDATGIGIFVFHPNLSRIITFQNNTFYATKKTEGGVRLHPDSEVFPIGYDINFENNVFQNVNLELKTPSNIPINANIIDNTFTNANIKIINDAFQRHEHMTAKQLEESYLPKKNRAFTRIRDNNTFGISIDMDARISFEGKNIISDISENIRSTDEQRYTEQAIDWGRYQRIEHTK